MNIVPQAVLALSVYHGHFEDDLGGDFGGGWGGWGG